MTLTEHANFARTAITAAKKTVAPEATVAELAEHGRRLADGTASHAAPAHLTVEGRRQAAADAAEEQAVSRVRKPSPSPARTARPGPTLPNAARKVAAGVGAPLQQASAGLAEGFSGGAVAGNSAIGRILGAVLLGLGTLVIGGMFTKKDFGITLGGGQTNVVPAVSPAQGVTTGLNQVVGGIQSVVGGVGHLGAPAAPLMGTAGPGAAVTPVTHGALP